MAGRPVQALLDVGVLADDAGLEDGEVGGRRGRERLGEVLGEVAREAGLAGPRRPTSRSRGVTEVWNRRTRDRSLVSSSTLTSMPGGLAVERAADGS